MSRKRLLSRLLTSGVTAAVVIQSLPIMSIGQVIAEDRAAEEALRNELLSYTDEFPEGAIQFLEASGDMTEGDGDREITVVRLGDPSEAMSVDVKAYDVTAQYGTDYTLYTKAMLKKNYADDSQAGLPSVHAAMENGTFVTDAEIPEDDSGETELSEETAPVEEAEAETESDEDYEIIEAQVPEKEEAPSETEDGGLRSAFREQTGRDTVEKNWRNEYEHELSEEAAKTADNEVVDSFDGAFLTLDFAPGEYKKSVWVHVIDDEKAEIAESTALILGNASTGLIAGNMQYKVNIADNEETLPITFAMKDAEIITDRSASYAEVTIERLSGLDYYANATYGTGSGTAEAYDAYTPVDGGTLAFAPGQTEQKLRIDLADTAKTGSYFMVRLDKESNYIEENRSETRVYIGSKIADEKDILEDINAAPLPLPQPKPNIIAPVEGAKVGDTAVINGVKYSAHRYSVLKNIENNYILDGYNIDKADYIDLELYFESGTTWGAPVYIYGHHGNYWYGIGGVKYDGNNRVNLRLETAEYYTQLEFFMPTAIYKKENIKVEYVTTYCHDYELVSINENQNLTGYNYSSKSKPTAEADKFKVPAIENWNSNYSGESVVVGPGTSARMQNFSTRLTNGVEAKSFDVYTASDGDTKTYVKDIVLVGANDVISASLFASQYVAKGYTGICDMTKVSLIGEKQYLLYSTTTSKDEAIKDIMLKVNDVKPGSFVKDGRTYNRVLGDGSPFVIANPYLSMYGSEYISLYYTKDYDGLNQEVTGISVKDIRDGSILDQDGNNKDVGLFNVGVYLHASYSKYKYIGRLNGISDGSFNSSQIDQIINSTEKRSAVRNSNHKLYLSPIYTGKPAKVEFKDEDRSAVTFSGNFKEGDALECTQIDKVTVKAKDNSNGRNIKVGKFMRESFKNTNDTGKSTIIFPNDYAEDKYELTATVDIDNPKEVITACYARPTMTVLYHPDENKEENAMRTYGQVSVALREKPDEILAFSSYKGFKSYNDAPFLTSHNLDMLRNQYLLSGLIEEENEFFDTVRPNTGEIFHVRTIPVWTYLDKNGIRRSLRGKSLTIQPNYGDEVINYHFAQDKVDEHPESIRGKVVITEKPLFSSSEFIKVKESPAVGVDLHIGGYDALTKPDGTYETAAKFNKGDVVAFYAKYGTFMRTGSVDVSDNTVMDIKFDANADDKLNVSSSSIQKLEGEEKKTKEDIVLEDAKYYLNLSSTMSPGYTPKCAEFRVYSKLGDYKSKFTTQVDFKNDNTLSFEFNPTSMKCINEYATSGNSGETVYDSLEVGDTFTVTLIDTEGARYFEHQTAICISQKMSGMYMFNYKGVQKTDDSAFIQALGGISTVFDYALDSQASDEITGRDSEGKMHHISSIGWGKEFDGDDKKNGDDAVKKKEKDTKKTDKDAEESIKKSKKTDDDTGKEEEKKEEEEEKEDKEKEDKELTKDSKDDKMKVTESSSWSLNIKLGMILDCIKEEEDKIRQGQYYFNDFIIFANCEASYNHSWNIPIYGVNIKIKLGFSLGKLSDESDSGIRWHFYAKDPEGDRKYFSDSNTIEMLAWDGTKSTGTIGLNATIGANVAVELKLFSICGIIDVTVENKVIVDSEDGVGDVGFVKLKPAIYVDTALGKINIWSDTFKWDWTKGNVPKNAPRRYNAPPSDDEIQKEILFTSTANREVNDYSELYAKRRWNGDKFMQFAPGKPESAEEITETVLQTGFYDDSDIRVQNLGNGKYLAVFTDLVPERAESDAFGAYYSVYDGKSWSTPQLLEDDGTIDSLPTICNAGSKGWLIVWSDASRKLDANEDIGSAFNTYDLTGRFYDAENNKFGDVMEITKTGGSDTVCDDSPEISYYEQNGQEFMKIYYTKSEFSVSSEEEGEVIGDILNPYEVKAVRNYDFENDKWADTYFGSVKEYLIEKRGEEGYKDYAEKWYGQEFLTLAPTVEVEESMNEHGFWKEGTVAKVTAVDLDQTMAKDSAVITYNNLSLQAYTLDKGGMAQESSDESLYLQIYNYQTDEYHHPILISGKNSDISDLKFIRMLVKGADGTSSEATYLYWLENSYIKRLNISNVVKNCLISAKTDSGQEYYYINKAADSAFIPEDILASPTITVNDDGEENMERFITSFKVKQNGNYNYMMWIESIQQELENEGDAPRMEQQLFAVREDITTGEITYPIQITDKKDQFISRFDFEVTDSGELDVLAGRMMLDADGKFDTNTSEFAAFHIKPSDKLVIADVSDANISMTDEGKLAAEINIALENKNFNTQKNVVAEVQDEEGNVFFTSDTPFATYEAKETTLDDGTVVFDELIKTETPRNMTMLGGQSEIIPVKIPMDDSGDYSGKLVIKADGNVIETRELSGKLRPELEADGFMAEISDRNEVTLNASVKNNNVLINDKEEVVYGYVDADGNKVELGKTTINPLDLNEAADVEATASVDFSKFIGKLNEDGSFTDSLEFYMDCDDFDTVYYTVDLTASAEEYQLMTNLKNFDAKPSQYNFDGDLEKIDSFNIGDKAYLSLWVEDDFAQNIENYTNRTKIVWTESEDQVASVTRDGLVTANGKGSTTLKGYIVPIDTGTILYEDGSSMSIDNYVYKPDDVVIPISAVITVGDAETDNSITTTLATTTETTTTVTTTNENIASDSDIIKMVVDDYQTKNHKVVSVTQLVKKDDGNYEITLTDEVGNTLDKYVIDPKTGTGTNSANEVVNLPQTGNNSMSNVMIIFGAVMMMGLGTIVCLMTVKRDRRRKKQK